MSLASQPFPGAPPEQAPWCDLRCTFSGDSASTTVPAIWTTRWSDGALTQKLWDSTKRRTTSSLNVGGLLVSSLTVVAVSTLSRMNQDSIKYKRYLLKALAVTAFVGMGIGVDLTLVGKDVIRLLLGPGWDEAGRIFTFFGPGIGIMLLYGTHSWIHLSIGKPDRWFRWGVGEFAVYGAALSAGTAVGAGWNRCSLDCVLLDSNDSRPVVCGETHSVWDWSSTRRRMEIHCRIPARGLGVSRNSWTIPIVYRANGRRGVGYPDRDDILGVHSNLLGSGRRIAPRLRTSLSDHATLA